MSKIPPQKIPPWIASFAEFVRKSNKGENDMEGDIDDDTNETLESYAALLAKHWELFYLEMKDKKKSKPSKKKTTDPMKTLGTAMDRVAGLVQDAKDNQELLQQYQERLREIVPEEIKTMMLQLGHDDDDIDDE
jgi:hypothetical protein